VAFVHDGLVADQGQDFQSLRAVGFGQAIQQRDGFFARLAGRRRPFDQHQFTQVAGSKFPARAVLVEEQKFP